MKKVLKLFVLILVIVLLFLVAISIKTYASDEYKITTENFKPRTSIELEKETRIARRVLGWIRNITVVAAVVIIAYFGLKFMYGSVEQRADYKKSFIPLIVGLFIVASATSIMSAVWKIGENENKVATCVHSFEGGGYPCEKAMTCTKCGTTIGPTGHNWEYHMLTGHAWYTCTNCGKQKDA